MNVPKYNNNIVLKFNSADEYPYIAWRDEHNCVLRGKKNTYYFQDIEYSYEQGYHMMNYSGAGQKYTMLTKAPFDKYTPITGNAYRFYVPITKDGSEKFLLFVYVFQVNDGDLDMSNATPLPVQVIDEELVMFGVNIAKQLESWVLFRKEMRDAQASPFRKVTDFFGLTKKVNEIYPLIETFDLSTYAEQEMKKTILERMQKRNLDPRKVLNSTVMVISIQYGEVLSNAGK